MKGGICLDWQFSVREGVSNHPMMFEDMGTKVIPQLMVLKNNITSHVFDKIWIYQVQGILQISFEGCLEYW